MKTLEEYIQLAAKDGSTRSGIILGIRLALLGVRELGRLVSAGELRDFIVFVETDRCLPDALELVTGCRLGNRRLKFRDLGKMAATFADAQSGKAIRVAAREGWERIAPDRYPELDKEAALVRVYSSVPDEDLFYSGLVRVEIAPEEVPGYHSERTVCDGCGEGVSFGRIVHRGGRIVCLACAGESYYRTEEQISPVG